MGAGGAELPGSGSRSAVFLVHIQIPDGALGFGVEGGAGRKNRWGCPPGVPSNFGCYHRRCVNVL